MDNKISYKKYLQRARSRRPDVREKNRIAARKYNDAHREEKRQRDREYYYKNRTVRMAAVYIQNNKPCIDPVLGDAVKYNTLVRRKSTHPNLYKGVKLSDCIVKVPTVKGLDKEPDIQRALEEKNENVMQ